MNRCPNCQQPLLPDDAVCWQCGTRVVPLTEMEEATVASVRDQWSIDEAGVLAGLDRGSWAKAVYIGLTGVLLVALLLVLGQLHRQPLSQVSFGDVIPVGYRVALDENHTLSFDLPQTWRTFDPAVAAERPALTTLIEAGDGVFGEGLQPWDSLGETLELVYIAVPNEPFVPGQTPFVAVARSGVLGGVPLDSIVLTADQVDWLAERQLELVENGDKTHVRYDFVTYPLDEARQAEFSGHLYLCSQEIFPGTTAGTILSVCLPQQSNQPSLQIRNDQALKSNVLESFQNHLD